MKAREILAAGCVMTEAIFANRVTASCSMTSSAASRGVTAARRVTRSTL
jgi:hypothetical protein